MHKITLRASEKIYAVPDDNIQACQLYRWAFYMNNSSVQREILQPKYSLNADISIPNTLSMHSFAEREITSIRGEVVVTLLLFVQVSQNLDVSKQRIDADFPLAPGRLYTYFFKDVLPNEQHHHVLLVADFIVIDSTIRRH
ncbi:hypothetical protein CLF_103479 [Clonorchis sinensis]|uniref:Uncharacterized protein n=1 Tax=Clonorchis sinensis TaxID=79923 RepID=G7Y9T7_CLOSI|nr:hypothetical protein CLF_103479 [Clonorchis sinensis]